MKKRDYEEERADIKKRDTFYDMSVKLVPGFWFPAPGSRFLLPCSLFPVRYSRFLVLVPRFPFPGSCFPIPGFPILSFL